MTTFFNTKKKKKNTQKKKKNKQDKHTLNTE